MDDEDRDTNDSDNNAVESQHARRNEIYNGLPKHLEPFDGQQNAVDSVNDGYVSKETSTEKNTLDVSSSSSVMANMSSASVEYQQAAAQRQSNDGVSFNGRSDLFGLTPLRHLDSGLVHANSLHSIYQSALSAPAPYSMPFGLTTGGFEYGTFIHRPLHYYGHTPSQRENNNDATAKSENQLTPVHQQLPVVSAYQLLSPPDSGLDSSQLHHPLPPQQQLSRGGQSIWVPGMMVKVERDGGHHEDELKLTRHKTFQQLISSSPDSWSTAASNNSHLYDERNTFPVVESTVANLLSSSSYGTPMSEATPSNSYTDWTTFMVSASEH